MLLRSTRANRTDAAELPASVDDGRAAGTSRPQLLVSVRSAEEARRALAGGAEWIDVKEPTEGALGRAPDETLEAVARCLRAHGVPSSAALGELRDLRELRDQRELRDGAHASSRSFAAALPGSGREPSIFGLYKAGLAGERFQAWRETLCAVRRDVREAGADLVAVAYADGARAGSPRLEDVLELAISERFPFLLVDTFVKDGTSLLDHVDAGTLAALVRSAHGASVRVALAGSLRLEHVPTARELGADVLAVRGAATSGDRGAPVDEGAVRGLRAALERSAERR